MKLVPPPRPVATKLSDSSALLEWPEYQLNGGGGGDLEVAFIKVQYRETSSGGATATSAAHSRTWNTLDEDLPPTTTSYVVTGLQPGRLMLLTRL